MEKLNKLSEVDAYLLQSGQPFVVKMTMNTKRIIAPDAKIMLSESHLTGSELGFLRKVKSDAEFYNEFLCKNRSVERNLIKYVKLSNVPRGTYRNYHEVDINRAYWETAFRMGVISESVYKLAFNHKKSVRMIALGALATGRVDLMFDGVEITEITEKPEPGKDLSYIFFKVAHTVGIAVNSVYLQLNEMEPDGCLGYWIDALFVKKHLAKKAKELMSDLFGFECKDVPLSSVSVVEKPTEKKLIMIEKPKVPCENFLQSDIRIKPFTIPGYKVRKRKKAEAKRIAEALRRLGY